MSVTVADRPAYPISASNVCESRNLAKVLASYGMWGRGTEIPYGDVSFIFSSLFTISGSQQKINNEQTNKYTQIKPYRIGLLKTY